MTQTEINQVVDAMELRPEYKNILRKCLSGDIDSIKEAIEELNQANAEINTKLGTIEDKVNNIQSDVFVIVDTLPTENIKNKIYCVKDTTGGGTNNKYIEYIYVESTKSWEKVGEFKADPDLSGYAKLTGAAFTGDVHFKSNSGISDSYLKGCWVTTYGNGGKYLYTAESNKPNVTYATDGSLANIGTAEDFIFTLDDGTTVTKSIRVISTTNEAE